MNKDTFIQKSESHEFSTLSKDIFDMCVSITRVQAEMYRRKTMIEDVLPNDPDTLEIIQTEERLIEYLNEDFHGSFSDMIRIAVLFGQDGEVEV